MGTFIHLPYYKYVPHIVCTMQQIKHPLFSPQQREDTTLASLVAMPSSKRELLGHNTRPSPLKVSKDSFKAKKPAPADHFPPVIFHMQSPRVIHARPQDFMRVVQLLTGKNSAAYAPVQPPDICLAIAPPSERALASPNGVVREFRFY